MDDIRPTGDRGDALQNTNPVGRYYYYYSNVGSKEQRREDHPEEILILAVADPAVPDGSEAAELDCRRSAWMP